MKRKIKGFVFDIGNVLVQWSTSNIISKYESANIRKTKRLNVVTEAMNVRIDKGEPFRTIIAEYIEKYPEFENALIDWRDNWIHMFRPKIHTTWVVFNELKQMGYQVYALSNFGRETFEMACDVYPELNTFDKQFISGHLGVVKPDQLIYEKVENETGLVPSQLFFIDDNKENCNAAEERGWQIHRFTNGKRLRNHLKSLGINLQNLT